MRQTWPCALLCQAGPREGSRKERWEGRGQNLQEWCPGIEAVRWGSIDQQEGSSDQLMETAGGSAHIYKPWVKRCAAATEGDDRVTPDEDMQLCAALDKTVLVEFDHRLGQSET